MKFCTLGYVPDRISSWPWWGKALAPFAAGAVMVPAMPPFGLWPGLFIGLSAFYVLLSTVGSVKQGFLYGWLFGFGYFLFGLSWIANALLVEGNQYLWAWPLAVAGLPALLAVFTALGAAMTVRLSRLRTAGGLYAFLFFMMLAEWLRGHIFTGFPWNLYAYGWASSLPMVQMVSLIGTYGLSLLTLFWACMVGFLYVWPQERNKKLILAGMVVLSMAGSFVYGHMRLNNNPTQFQDDVLVRLVQPNIHQEDKWNPEKADENFSTLVRLSEPTMENQNAKTLIIWPETAISQAYMTRSNPDATQAIQAMMDQYKAPAFLITGISRYERDALDKMRYFNSIVTLNAKLEAVSTYNKSHLVPFGEYMPLQRWIPLGPLAHYAGFTPGDGRQTLSIPGIGLFSPLVCYEIIFPGAVSDRTGRPDFIVNVTNDAWYGDSAGPRQHFTHAVFRAVEEGLPVIRAANTGISGIADPLGRVIVAHGLLHQSGDNSMLPAPLATPPLYVRTGDMLVWVTMLLLGTVFLFFSRKTLASI
ncbi:MAG: apolipoprotein N-acyltransferase [Rhodospirillales bacterium]|nr:apolipoprotein N-acyltransferase [Rhodospirillales bacterium]MCB9995785.1 apolipoprotein N-acyltransferase [Rhodospirillales bacterium]